MKRILLAGIGAMVFGFSAEAATISFIDEAAGNERGLANSGDFINYGDVTVTFSANETYHPYLMISQAANPLASASARCSTAGTSVIRPMMTILASARASPWS